MRTFVRFFVAILGLYLGWCTSEQVSEQPAAAVALVSDEPEITVQTLADRFRERVNAVGNDQLVVHSDQRISYLVLPLTSGQNPERDVTRAFGLNSASIHPVEPVVVDVTIDSFMRPDYVHSMFRRADVDRVVTILYSSSKICEASFYYPTLDTTNGVKVDASELEEGEYFRDYIFERVSNPLLPEFPVDCDTAEFWFSWPHDYINSWVEDISQGKLQDAYNYNGRDTFRIKVEIYDEDFGSRNDFYLIDQKTGLLVGWQKFICYIDSGSSAHYQVVDASYEYTFPEEELVVSSSDGNE